MRKLGWLGILLIVSLLAVGLITFQVTANQAEPAPEQMPQAASYIVLAWNNLGMHCYNPDFSTLAILPPYNTLVAQVIRVGDPPQVVSTGVVVRYSFPDNTYSAGVPGNPDKTNFWEYVDELFGVSPAPNIGLTGKGLSGTMDPSPNGDYFIAEGIPLTEVRDQDTATMARYPFQQAQITVWDAANPDTVKLAELTVVAPVSTELMCVNCHDDTMDATTRYAPAVQPTGRVETNILTIHDYLNKDNYATYLASYPDLLAKTPLIDHQPVLCADCHASNALGMPTVGDIKSLSNAIHGHHNPDNAPDITPDTAGCYNCHPGPETQCLRDTMSQNYSLNCTSCHGDITVVAQNPNPWLNEPRCSNSGCHGSEYAPNLPLYRESKGHGGVFCEACHDSTHAIATSREANDAIKFVQLQGAPGTLRQCTTCHASQPADMFKHALYMGYSYYLPVNVP